MITREYIESLNIENIEDVKNINQKDYAIFLGFRAGYGGPGYNNPFPYSRQSDSQWQWYNEAYVDGRMQYNKLGANE